MAKKARQATAEPIPSAVPHRDVLNRLNFMYQASVLLAAIVPQPRAQPPPKEAAKPKKSLHLLPTQPGPSAEDDSMSVVDPSQDWLNFSQAPQSPTDSIRPQPVASTSALPQAQLEPEKKTKRKAGGRKRVTAAGCASVVLAKNMNEVAKKATLRMDPTVKRTICRRCNAVLVAGLTSKVRVKASGPHAHVITHSCLSCEHTRRLPAPPHKPQPPQPQPNSTTADAATVGESMQVDGQQGEEDAGLNVAPIGKPTRWEAKQLRRAREAVFFERAGHVSFVGLERVERDV